MSCRTVLLMLGCNFSTIFPATLIMGAGFLSERQKKGYIDILGISDIMSLYPVLMAVQYVIIYNDTTLQNFVFL